MFPKLYLYLAAAFILLGAVAGIYWKGHSDGVDKQRAEYAKAIDTARTAKEAKEAQDRAASTQRETEYLGRVRNLEERERHLVQPQHTAIRLCSGSSDGVPKSSIPAPSPDASPDRGQAVRDGKDFQPELVRLGTQCEQDRQQLIALQNWVLATR